MDGFGHWVMVCDYLSAREGKKIRQEREEECSLDSKCCKTEMGYRVSLRQRCKSVEVETSGDGRRRRSDSLDS